MARNRTSLRDEFADLGVDEPLKVDIEGRQLELEVFANDINTFMLIGQKEHNRIEEEDLERLEDTLRRILQRSYLPYYNLAGDKEMSNLSKDKQNEQDEEKKFIENLLARYYIDIFRGVMEELGLADEEIDDEKMEEIKKKAT